MVLQDRKGMRLNLSHDCRMSKRKAFIFQEAAAQNKKVRRVKEDFQQKHSSQKHEHES